MNSEAQTFQQALRHHQAGELHQAELLYRQVLEREPRHADALHMFGVIARQVGRHDLAAEYIQQAIRVRPEFPEAHNNLGIALIALGKGAEALASFQRAVALKPDFAEALGNLGNALKDHGRLDEAIASHRRALHLRPNSAQVHNNLGNALAKQGKLEDAVASYEQALRLKSDYPEALNNLGNTLTDLGRLEAAIANCRGALRLRPNFADAYYNLGNAYSAQGDLDEAIANYQHALRLKPDYAKAYVNLGNALKDGGRLEEAIASYQRSATLQPDCADAYFNLGIARKDQGGVEDAISAYRKALALKPDMPQFHSNLVFILHYHPGYDAAALCAEARHWNDLHAAPLARFHQPHANTAEPNRRLRIGYVSPDFRNHAVANFLIPLLSNHDRSEAEIFCYADVAHPDDMTERLRKHADVWHDTVELSDERVAERVRDDRIDILVDLALHTAHNRLLVFARKPAPVQVSWLGYPGTTGLTAIDYRLTDPYFDPPELGDACYAEQSIRLPDTAGCYDPLAEEVPVSGLPADENGYVTFGCLNNFSKVNAGALALWARVLRDVPRSRFVLRAPRGQARDAVLASLRHEGIAESRVEFDVLQPSRLEYLRTYNRIDVCFDPTLYNGYTTSLDASWMGVPIVTLVGKTAVGRAGWSLLCNLGLRELAARTEDEYVAIAMVLANDLPRLRELRAGLRERLRASPLMDAPRFARHIEQSYRRMWRTWCGNIPGPV
jgi:predicted O-linked N-acetylglucosamine transferase (SPINDLY family)